MFSRISIAIFVLVSVFPLNATVIVNGVAGEDSDNVSPFETLSAAIAYANTQSDPVIEIQTNGPIAGFDFSNSNLSTPLTIQASMGFIPVINSAVSIIPTNSAQQVTLNNLTISTNVATTPTTVPLNVGCNLTASNCVFNSNPTTGTYHAAVTCAVPSTTSDNTLNLTSCTLTGHIGLEAGRSCRQYNITNCIISGVPTALDPKFSVGISNLRNWRSALAGTRMGTAQGFVEISNPRTLAINNSIIRGGMPLGWPSNANPASFSTNENTTMGPIEATNTTFVHLRNSIAAAQASIIGNPALPANQNAIGTFKHCTFHSSTPASGAGSFGLLYFPGSEVKTHTISNCFFDGPSNNYAIFNPTGSNQTIAGDANSYAMRTGREIIISGAAASGTPFEGSQFDYFASAITDPTFSDTLGNLLSADSRIVARALPLTPPVTTDKDNNPRPMPVGAVKSDIGSDEIDETAPSKVDSWDFY